MRARQRCVRLLGVYRSSLFQVEETHSYRETPNRLQYMTEIRDVLDLDRDDLPDHTTLYKSFYRLKM
jgi:hypothetical protein